MGSEGLKAIADAIEINQSLVCIDVSSNLNIKGQWNPHFVEFYAPEIDQVFQYLVNAMIGNYSLLSLEYTRDTTPNSVWDKSIQMSRRILWRNRAFVSGIYMG
jgi:hypothetical protein